MGIIRSVWANHTTTVMWSCASSGGGTSPLSGWCTTGEHGLGCLPNDRGLDSRTTCRSNGETSALKVQKSASHYTEAAKDEIEILRQLKSRDSSRAHHVVQLLDHFTHTGPHGTHVCMVFEMMGQNLLSLIKYFNYSGIPLDAVKVIARQLCEGLDYVHTACSLIHTDLKPENVLICLPRRVQVKLRALAARAHTTGATGAAGDGSSSLATVPDATAIGTKRSAEIQQLHQAVEALVIPRSECKIWNRR